MTGHFDGSKLSVKNEMTIFFFLLRVFLASTQLQAFAASERT